MLPSINFHSRKFRKSEQASGSYTDQPQPPSNPPQAASAFDPLFDILGLSSFRMASHGTRILTFIKISITSKEVFLLQ
ncbi:uncharacterized protein MELLADRAFT_95751 [Melampsora larici-populina 98AG31]|uniref:Uncharacterized protein n=1 Tax=Melampsora larici-populina (strain 98AG31 / pathotype 3-4-7) TaxID=747676 RepID=F4SAG6_MELLP|nr:uncharacterized protein MELLADRAFT_95751 [Melampsora larici-populina 98AG31]EGF98360.1 hypothetical protein MELLADRAFT_95751 [Melampsora larici-populina 98AG31]